MLEPETYRIGERLAKAQLPTWRLAQTHAVEHFEKTGFPVRVSSLREVGQLLDTMQENRFDGYMRELGGLTGSEYALLIKACRDVVLFQLTFFANRKPTLPLSTLLAVFTLYRKFLAVDGSFRSVLEIGPGCGYLPFFLRHHAALENYSQIEACESFYLLQHLVDLHCFPARLDERALLPGDAPVLDYYSPAETRPAYTEISRPVRLSLKRPLCTHYPWWRIGELVRRDDQFQIVTSNANLLEFSRPALDDYLTLLGEVLAPDGVFIVQCTGLAANGTLASLTDMVWQKGFATLMFAVAGKRVVAPGLTAPAGVVARLSGGTNSRVFPVNNCLFVKAGHPLFERYRGRASTHVVADEPLVRDVFFAEPAGRRMYGAEQFVADTERSLQDICVPAGPQAPSAGPA
jgi:hypothetical protein